MQQQIIDWVGRIADIADRVSKKVAFCALTGFAASAVIAWSLVNLDGALWWNGLKVGVVMLPAAIWGFVWLILSQLKQAPDLVADLVQQESGLFNNLDSINLREKDGLRGLVSTLREFRKEEGLSIVFDTIGGISLLANPFFLVLTALAGMGLLILILIAPIVIIF